MKISNFTYDGTIQGIYKNIKQPHKDSDTYQNNYCFHWKPGPIFSYADKQIGCISRKKSLNLLS